MCKALIVDDEHAVLDVMARIFEMDGFSVLKASSAGEGAAILGNDQVDVVITDLRMESPLAGFDVVKAAARIVPRPLIVILTAFPVPPADWKPTGADALLLKGTNLRAISRQLKALLEKRHDSVKL